MFLTNFEVFGQTLSEVFDISSQSKLKLTRKRRINIVKICQISKHVTVSISVVYTWWVWGEKSMLFLFFSYWNALCDRFWHLATGFPTFLASRKLWSPDNFDLFAPSLTDLVFGLSRNKKLKHRRMSIENCMAVCFWVISCCSFFSTSQKVIQLTALEDWSVSEKQQWDSAVKFMESTLQDELDKGIHWEKIMLRYCSTKSDWK